MPARTRLLPAFVTVLLFLTGCTAESADVPSEAADQQAGESAGAPGREPEIGQYVALGDSFTAAPFVPTTDVADGCFRSDGNYPSLVAERLDFHDFVDVSCSGASTRNLTRPQPTVQDATVPPQLDALTGDTDLVTLGIGGNDFNLFTTLLQTCTRLGQDQPNGSPCSDYLAARGIDLMAEAGRIRGRVVDAVDQVRDRAPDARVLLVGYPRIGPSDGTCPRLLPFASGDYRQADLAARSLNDALRAAARSTDVEFVDMYAASDGHDVCSDRPWVNGQFTDRAAALAFHPLPAGMAAVANRVLDTLG